MRYQDTKRIQNQSSNVQFLLHLAGCSNNRTLFDTKASTG